MPLKLEKRKNDCFYKIILPLHYQTLSSMLWLYENDSILNATFLAFTKITDTFNKNKRCHVTLHGLNSVCAKLELASCKRNEILAISVLQKFTLHALYVTVKVFITDNVFLAISPLEELIVAKI